jgi:eukaryotic-like serine/threonine-protein kinase
VHQEGVYHLDLKPDNVMVTGDGRIVLVDFGSARQDLSAMSSSQKSSTMAFTPDYAPPELLSGQPVGAESDLFELGMMLHEMLTGSRPPAVLSRLSQEVWSPPSLREPWQSMLTQALRLERTNRPAQVKQWWHTQVSWGENQQEFEAQERQQEAERQLHQEAEERAAEQRAAAEERNRRQAQEQAKKEAARREPQAKGEEVARTRAEAAKLKHPEAERKAVPTPIVPPAELKSAIQLNRRVLLTAGLGIVGLGGARLVSEVTRQQTVSGSSSSPSPAIDESSPMPAPESPAGTSLSPVATPLSPAPFTSPSSFSFEVVTVNETGQVVNREQKSARYFTEDLGSGVTLEMLEIPAGDFMMGSPTGELNRKNNESPQHRVKIAGFSMGRFTITKAQWQAVMENNPASFKGENHPQHVAWLSTYLFYEKLSQKTGRTYRLPSEAEWEYACRAGTTTPFHFAPTITPELANYNGGDAYGSGPKGVYREKTTPVGSFPANGFGLHDMHGNVWEWCSDRLHESYSGAPTDGSAREESVGPDPLPRVLRGGSWDNYPRFCRSAFRFRSISEQYMDDGFGFRIVTSSP